MLAKRKFILPLIIILLVTLAFRLYFSLQSPYFSSDEAYFHLRHADYILENGRPMTYDELSYDGKPSPYPPLYNYLIALFALFMPIELAAKILPSILYLLIPLISYFIAYELSKNETASLFASFFSSFIPLNIERTLNTSSVYSLVLPIFLFAVYCLIKLREERAYLPYFVITVILFPLTHSSSFLFVAVLMVYSLIMISENLVIRRTTKESIIFSILVIIFTQFIIFKQAFLENGISILWQNTPSIVFNTMLEQLNLTSLIFDLGLLPLILGTISILFIILFNRKDSHILMISIVLTMLSSALFKLISVDDAIIFLSITLAILSSLALSRLFSYIDVTKVSHRKPYFIYTFIFLSLILSFIPSILAAQSSMKNIPADIDIEALTWIKDNIDYPVVIAALPEEGNMLAYITGKSNVVDDYYILADNPEERLQDISDLYTTYSEFKALDVALKYNINFIFLSEKAKSKYNLEDLNYVESRRCFDRRKYETFGKIYQVRKC